MAILTEEMKATARLFGSAGELLASLEEALAAMQRMDAEILDLTDSFKEQERPEIVRARAAIAKARGQ